MSQKNWYWLGRAVIDAYAHMMFKLDVVRHAPLPKGPKLFAANHPTTLDPAWVMMLADEQTSVLILDTLFNVPLFGGYLRRAGHVSVTPVTGREAFDESVRLLQAGRSVVQFPEGDISPLAGGLHRAHTGVARQALIAGVPVIPVGIGLQRERITLRNSMVRGKQEQGTWYLSGRYAMTVGQPLHFQGDVEDRVLVRRVSDQIMERIGGLAHDSAQRVQNAQARAGGLVLRPVRVADLR